MPQQMLELSLLMKEMVTLQVHLALVTIILLC
jgi:hypothetical protein